MLDGTYYLHFAIKGSDSSVHAAHQSGSGRALFTLGETALTARPSSATSKRDGSWYNFDIPFSVFSNQVSPLFESANGGASAYKENAVYFRSGGNGGQCNYNSTMCSSIVRICIWITPRQTGGCVWRRVGCDPFCHDRCRAEGHRLRPSRLWTIYPAARRLRLPTPMRCSSFPRR